MTREEAIELIDDIIGFVEDNHGRDYDGAFRMAIEALQTDLVRCKDCRFYWGNLGEDDTKCMASADGIRTKCQTQTISVHTEKGESHEVCYQQKV